MTGRTTGPIILVAVAVLAIATGLGAIWGFNTVLSMSSGSAGPDGWIHYKVNDYLNARIITVKLHRAADGRCIQRFAWKGPTLHPGDPPLARQEIGYNPTTCQVRYEQGTPSDAVP